MRKQQGVDWHLDLKPVRRPVKAPAAPRHAAQTPPAAPATPPAVPTEAAPTAEFLHLLNTLNDKIDALTARLAVVEKALAKQSARATERPRREQPPRLHSAPSPINAPVPIRDAGATAAS